MTGYRRRRRNESVSTGSNTGQMMNLALFIMLLAFFIVLNTLSSYEDIKADKVRRSVELAFSKDAEIKEEMPSVKEDVAQSLKVGHTFDRIDALFESEIISFESTKSTAQGVMMVRVPYKKFSDAILVTNQKDLFAYPSRQAVRENIFLPTLVSLLRRNIDGAPTRMEILVHTDENPAEIQNLEPKKFNSVMSEVALFSRRLEKQGMPQKLINIGVAKGDPEYIDLVFRKYIPFSPLPQKEE